MKMRSEARRQKRLAIAGGTSHFFTAISSGMSGIVERTLTARMIDSTETSEPTVVYQKRLTETKLGVVVVVAFQRMTYRASASTKSS